ncbi:MAG: PAS domain-containing protein [Desulfomonilaceae bacterium]|nr:PAS domain-containing protein [Desulfomonilaceae bacterium]
MKDYELTRNQGGDVQGTVQSMKTLSAPGKGGRKLDEHMRKASAKTDYYSHHAPLGMVIISKEGSFEYVNPKFTQMFGYALDEVPDGKTWFRKAYPDDRYRHEVIRTWLGVATDSDKGELTSKIFTVKCKNGELKTVHFRPVQLESGQYLMTCEDITELTKAAEALRLEKAKFQVLAENLPLGVVLISEDGTYEYVNPKFTQMFGYDLNDVPNGREWFKKAFPDPRYREEAMSAWIIGRKPGEQRPRTFTVTCKDGQRKTVHFRPVQLETGEQLMTCEDVAECVLRMIYGVTVE